MERSQNQPWVQVIGQIAVREPGRRPVVLSGASRTLLAILVAAGPDGASVEEIADSYWPGERPASWHVALRIAAAHLSTLLPPGWDVTVTTHDFRLAPTDGFVDAWRLEEEMADPSAIGSGPRWLVRGRPFDGIEGIDLVERAARRLAPLLSEHVSGSAIFVRESARTLADPEHRQALRAELQRTRRAIVVAPTRQHTLIADLARGDPRTETHMVVGDRGLLLPLGPFAMAFPELRERLSIEQGAIERGSAAEAFRVVADTLSKRATECRQQLIIARVSELDRTSLQLASMLIDRAPPTDFGLVLLADPDERDIRWLDFLRRARTAGCELIDVPH